MNILSATRTLSANDVYNDIYVSVESIDIIENYYTSGDPGASSGINYYTNASTTLAFETWDGDPSSPTYIGGAFGRIPEFINSTVSNTIQAAQVESFSTSTSRLAKWT